MLLFIKSYRIIQGAHTKLHARVRERMMLMKRLKNAVDDLAGEIPNHSKMYNFVKLKREVNSLVTSFTKKFIVLRSCEESLKNIWANENPQALRHFLKFLACDVHVVMENLPFPDNWTTAQFFQVMCEEIMERAKRQIDVDKIFTVKAGLFFFPERKSTSIFETQLRFPPKLLLHLPNNRTESPRN